VNVRSISFARSSLLRFYVKILAGMIVTKGLILPPNCLSKCIIYFIVIIPSVSADRAQKRVRIR
jgi:hypothetical protein